MEDLGSRATVAEENGTEMPEVGLYVSVASDTSDLECPKTVRSVGSQTQLSIDSAVLSLAASPSFGYCLSTAVYMLLESILVRCEAERLTLFLEHSSGALFQSVNVGVGMPPARRNVAANATGLVAAVFSTKIAANLDSVSVEDIADCPGPTAAKNALFFPVRRYSVVNRDGVTAVDAPCGVVVIINKKHGTEPFNDMDERLLHMMGPSISYLAEHYPLEQVATRFNPSLVHLLAPLPTVSTTPNSLLPASLSAEPIQRVYHRSGAERFIRKSLMSGEGVYNLELTSCAANLQAVEEYISMLEESWKATIEDGMEVQKELQRKAQHINDAREILIRKQRKLDLLKEALIEQIEKFAEVARSRSPK